MWPQFPAKLELFPEELAICSKKLARFTNKLGTNFLISWPELLQGAVAEQQNICTEGVKIALFFFKQWVSTPNCKHYLPCKNAPGVDFPFNLNNNDVFSILNFL